MQGGGEERGREKRKGAKEEQIINYPIR